MTDEQLGELARQQVLRDDLKGVEAEYARNELTDCLKRAIRILNQAGYAVEDRRPTHRHLKRKTLYCVIGIASLQTSKPIEEGSILTIYRDADGRLWARPHGEFNDGRFAALTEKGR